MDRMPGAMFIVDTRREHIAVKEAKKLGVPTIALIDTDSDPDLIDLPIPGNDDAMRAIEIIVHQLADAVIEGKQTRPDKGGDEAAAGQPQRRRSTRSQFRADEPRPEGQPDLQVQIPAPSETAPAEQPVAAGQGA
jgi:small subunit ribosomal protein S2